MKNSYKNKNIIGCDETGVGDYLTPLVASSVFVPYKNVEKLINIGVTDSKKISKTKIIALAKEIKPLVNYSIEYLNQNKYNKLNELLNANELKMFLHIKCINKIEEKTLQKENVDLIIIDKFSNENSVNKYINKLLNKNFGLKPLKNGFKLITQGEMEHVSVAAASILAREKFFRLMNQQNKKWNENFPLGINQNVKKFAINFVDKNGLNNLNEIAKIKFKTTKELFNKYD